MLVEINNQTKVEILIDAELADVEPHVIDIANELGFASQPEGSDPLEFVIKQTKQWWFDNLKSAVSKRIELEAEQAAEQARLAGLQALENSPLLGA